MAVYDDDLVGLLAHHRPSNVLLVSAGDADTLAELCARPGQDPSPREVEHLSAEDALERLQDRGRYDFVFLAEGLERLPKDTGLALLARLRDLHARVLCVVVATGAPTPPGGSTWQPAELRALGLTLLRRYPAAGKTLSLYGFDIATYKHTPDWLNPRFWAHPELWGKYRW